MTLTLTVCCRFCDDYHPCPSTYPSCECCQPRALLGNIARAIFPPILPSSSHPDRTSKTVNPPPTLAVLLLAVLLPPISAIIPQLYPRIPPGSPAKMPQNNPPIAKLALEDGTIFTGTAFGAV